MWKPRYHYLWLQVCVNEEKADKRETKGKIKSFRNRFHWSAYSDQLHAISADEQLLKVFKITNGSEIA